MSEALNDSVDSLVEKCIGVFSEIMLFGQSLERKIGSSYGFDGYYTLNERLDNLSRNTRSGKQLSKSSILLVHGVIEALLTRGRMQEKDLKEYLVVKFKQLGLKVSNRSVFGGTSLEVSSVCNVLAAVGLLESFTSEMDDENGHIFNSNNLTGELSQLDPSLKEALTRLNDALRIKFENTPFEAANKSDTVANISVPAPSSSSTAIVSSQTALQVDELPDGGLFDALLTDQYDATHLVSDHALTVDALSQNANHFGLNSSATTKKPSQSQTARKFWRIRNITNKASDDSSTAAESTLKQQTNALKLLQLVANASSTLFQWMQNTHSFATHCDIEEKLLRHTCYSLGISLPRHSMRDTVTHGTSYIAPITHRGGTNAGNKRAFSFGDGHNSGHSSQQQDMSSSGQFSQSKHDQMLQNTNRCKRDLLDDSVHFTGSMLIDKVSRSRRQRVSSSSGNANVFHAEGLHKLKYVTRKTLQFWQQQQNPSSEDETARSKKQRASDSGSGGGFNNVAVSFAEYLYSSQQNTTFNNQQTNVSANNNASVVFNNAVLSHALLAGTYPSVTSSAIRRYAPIHPLFYYEGVYNTLPDISIGTQPVAWQSLANEFSLVQLDETGEFVDGLSQQMLSQVARGLSVGNLSGLVNTSNSDAFNPPMTEASNALNSKKRNRSSSHLSVSHMEDADQSNTTSSAMNQVLKRKVISEVLAPQVKLTTLSKTEPISSISSISVPNVENEDIEENTSDEHYLARHDAVLRTMREKWALLSRLKHDVRRDSSSNFNLVGQPQQKRQRSISCEDLPSSLSLLPPSESGQYTSQEEFLQGDMTMALTPLTKKRGRPPKFHRSGSCKGTPATET